MLDFGNEREQSTGGCIPEDSICLFKLSIRKPEEPQNGKRDKRTKNPFVSSSESGIFYLDCCLECVSGTYEGRKIFEFIPLPSHAQRTRLTDGQQRWCGGGGATMRAILEAARGIDPKDKSQNAMQGRQADVNDFDGLKFPIKVGYKKIEDGDRYVNNRIKAIITPNRDGYADVMAGGEIITDKPIPEIVQVQTTSNSGYSYDNQPPTSAYDNDTNHHSNTSGMDDVPF